MKTIIKIIFSTILLVTMLSCQDSANNVDYLPPIKITFVGVSENNITQVAIGDSTYNASISITSTNGIYSVSLYNMDPKTGIVGTIIGTKMIFNPFVDSYSLSYKIANLTANKAIQIQVQDNNFKIYTKNLVVKVTPSVMTSDIKTIETAEVYYGPYYASWYNGRVYMRNNIATYGKEVDFSLANISIAGTVVPAFVSPNLRDSLGLLFIPNLSSCSFGLTAMTKADFDAITLINPTVINSMTTPTLTQIKAELGKVFVYENSTERGLIYISALVTKTATLEQRDGTWVKADNNYQELKIQTKSVRK